jgi:RND superfamily putative drug exporter
LSEQPRGWRKFATGRVTAYIVAIVPLLFGLGVIGGLGDAERERSATDQLPEGFDSTAAVALAESLPDTGTSAAVIVFSADEGQLTPEQIGGIAQAVESVGAQGPVPSDDGTAALAFVTLDSPSASELADHVAELRGELTEASPDGVTAQVTGPAGIEADLAGVFEGANFRLLGVTALVVAILLIVTYRSPVLWIIPLTVVGIADQAAAVLATRVLAAAGIPWNESTIGILSVLVFGAGTNYALLLISRYRDELRLTEDRRAAMRIAMGRTAEPVLASAGTVVVGLLTLLLSLIPTTRGLGVAGAVGIVTAATFVLGVLPSALVIFPRGIFWPRVPRVGDVTAAETRSVWRRIGDRVAKRPVLAAIIVTVSLGVLALGGSSIKLGLDTSEQFLAQPESIVAAERIGESFPAGTSNPTQVITRADAAAVAAAAAAVDGVASATPGLAGEGVSEIQVVLDASDGSDEAKATVAELRAALADFEDTHVGGPVAQSLDGSAANAQDRQLIMPLILVLVLGALILLLRAVVAPIILVATVVATYAAAMGAAWVIITQVMGYTAMDETVPLLAFLFLVALGVDYNIFLVTRAREEAHAHGTREGMLRALGATGGVITSAGILLAAVFAVLGVLPLVVLAQLGLVVCIGVLLDTLVVRTVLVPSITLVLGRRFWWPRSIES